MGDHLWGVGGTRAALSHLEALPIGKSKLELLRAAFVHWSRENGCLSILFAPSSLLRKRAK